MSRKIVRSVSTHEGYTVSEIEGMYNKQQGDIYIPTDDDTKTYRVDKDGRPKEGGLEVIYINHNANEYKKSDFTQVIAPIDGNWQAIAEDLGKSASWHKSPAVINRIFGLFCSEPEVLWCSDWSKAGGRFDPRIFDNPLVTEFKHTPQNPKISNEGIAYACGIAVSPDRSKVILTNNTRDNARVYDIETGDMLCNIGIPYGAGNVSDDKLNNPYGNPMWLDNDFVALPVFQGNTESSGGVYKYDTRLKDNPDGVMLMQGESSGGKEGEAKIDQPFDIVRHPTDPSRAFITEFGKNCVLMVNIENGWVIEKKYTQPTGVVWSGLWGMDVSFDGTMIAVVSQTYNEVTIINIETGEKVAHYNAAKYGVADLRAVQFFNDNFIAVAGYSTRNVALLPIKEEISINYDSVEIPDKMIFDKIVTQAGVIDASDLSAPQLTLDVSELSSVQPLVALFNKD